jgi:hypothetical protein
MYNLVMVEVEHSWGSKGPGALFSAALIAPCGMNCGLCARYLAQKHDLRGRGVKALVCAGCRPAGRQCALIIKQCPPLLHGWYHSCSECRMFPCAHLHRLDERYRQRYRLSMVQNLVFIREAGMEAFLAEERRKWACPKCGSAISCHNGLCFSCDLEKLRGRARPQD